MLNFSFHYIMTVYVFIFVGDYFINLIGGLTTKPWYYYRKNEKGPFSSHMKYMKSSFLCRLFFIKYKREVCLWYFWGQLLNFCFAVFYIVICLFFFDFAVDNCITIACVHFGKIFLIELSEGIDSTIIAVKNRNMIDR